MKRLASALLVPVALAMTSGLEPALAKSKNSRYTAVCDIQQKTGYVVAQYHNTSATPLSCGGLIFYEPEVGHTKECRLNFSRIGAGAKRLRVCHFYGKHNRPVKILECRLRCI